MSIWNGYLPYFARDAPHYVSDNFFVVNGQQKMESEANEEADIQRCQ